MKHTIWSNENLDVKDWIDGYKEYLEINDREVPEEIDEDDVYEWMYETNDEYLDDERVNLNKKLDSNIIVIADLGLWDGRRMGYKEIGNNIRDCLYADADYATWYVDGNKDLRCDVTHHDGTNHYLYREWKPGLSYTQRDNFCDKLYNGTATQKDITKYTKKIGDRISDIYGWR